MKIKSTFLATLITSGFSYLFCFLLIGIKQSKEPIAFGAAISFIAGLIVYLSLRKLYKNKHEFENLLAKAYRLIVWLIPLTLFTVQVFIYFNYSDNPPKYISFYTMEELEWASILAGLIWLILNFFILINNIIVVIWMALYYIGLPLLIIVNGCVIAILFLLYKKLIKLKQASAQIFSITKASLLAIIPMLLFMAILALSPNLFK